MTDTIEPVARVSYNERTVYTYPAPNARTNNNGNDGPNRRDWTIAELEDVLAHARMHDADDATLIKFDRYSSNDVTVTLPKSPDDIGKPFGQRYAPISNLYRWGQASGVGIVISIELVVAFLIAVIFG